METNLNPGLYLLATPIGNRGDITVRTLEILKKCDVIVSEDTRVARKLLSMYQIYKDVRNLISYTDNSGSYERRKIVELIHNGKSIALISDAGSPLISDPGYKLVSEVIKGGADVYSAPGPSSVISALSVSGLPSDRFFFQGFLSSKEKKILEELERLRSYSCTVIIFESPRRLIKTLKYIKKIFGRKHPLAVCREMTKKFEEIQRGSVEDLLQEFESRDKVKGEIVIVLGPKTALEMDISQIDECLRYELQSKSVKDSVEILAKALSISKRVIYDRALMIKNKMGE